MNLRKTRSYNLPTPSSDHKARNLALINERLQALRDAENIEQAFPGELQGVFVRKVEQTLEMYCYDNDTQKLSSIMSRIDLENPLNLMGIYTQVMFLSALWSAEPPSSVYMAGFGGGRIAMLFDHYFEGITIDGTDIDPNVIAASQVFFGLDKTMLSGINVADSREDLKNRPAPYDIILLDVFTGGGEHVNHLATVEFFELCKEKLTNEGVIVANLVEIDPLVERKIAAMQSVFKYSFVWQYNGAKVVFASDQLLDLEALLERVSDFQLIEKLDFDLVDKAKILRSVSLNETIQPLRDADL